MSRERPLHLEVARFCKWHLGKDCFAAFTGQDLPAWKAFVYLLQCFAHGGSVSAIAAMQHVVRCAQPRADILRVFVQAIPAVLDWQDVARLWPGIVAGVALDDLTSDRAQTLTAIERTEVVRGNRVEETRTAWGWRPSMVAAQAHGATP